MAKEEVEQAITGEVLVRVLAPRGMPVTYTDYSTVQSADDGIRISFCQLDWPLEDPERGPDGKPILNAHCAVRIALPVRQAVLLYDQLAAHLRNLQAQIREAKAKKEQE